MNERIIYQIDRTIKAARDAEARCDPWYDDMERRDAEKLLTYERQMLISMVEPKK